MFILATSTLLIVRWPSSQGVPHPFKLICAVTVARCRVTLKLTTSLHTKVATTVLPYSGKFSMVPNFENVPPTLQKKFSQLLFLRNKCVMLWLHPYSSWPCPTCKPKKQHWTTKWRASFSYNGLVFPLCRGLHNYTSIRTAAMGKKLACWTEGFSTTDLNFANSGGSLMDLLAFCTVAGWFFFTVII